MGGISVMHWIIVSPAAMATGLAGIAAFGPFVGLGLAIGLVFAG